MKQKRDRPSRRELASDGLLVLGWLLTSAGAWLLATWLGVMLLGLGLMAGAWLLARGGGDHAA